MYVQRRTLWNENCHQCYRNHFRTRKHDNLGLQLIDVEYILRQQREQRPGSASIYTAACHPSQMIRFIQMDVNNRFFAESFEEALRIRHYFRLVTASPIPKALDLEILYRAMCIVFSTEPHLPIIRRKSRRKVTLSLGKIVATGGLKIKVGVVGFGSLTLE